MMKYLFLFKVVGVLELDLSFGLVWLLLNRAWSSSPVSPDLDLTFDI